MLLRFLGYIEPALDEELQRTLKGTTLSAKCCFGYFDWRLGSQGEGHSGLKRVAIPSWRNLVEK